MAIMLKESNMEDKSSSNVNIRIPFVPPLIIGISLILCAFVVRSTMIKVKGFGSTIQVTGAAFKPITSDFAIWEASIQTNAMDIAPGYVKMKKDLDLVKAFLAENGFAENQIEIGAVQVNQLYDREGRPSQYSLNQSVKVQLADVPRMSQLGIKASILLEKGVNLGFQNVRYIYNKIEDAKIEMIKAATENAKLRAEQLANTAGKNIGAPTSARVGVFQIRPLHSQEVSDYGMNDVTSVEKEIVCTVQISFLID
jgi:hypothetical protein